MSDFLGIGAAVIEWRRQQEANRAPPHRLPFTPDEIHAAEIEAAREEGRRAGMMEAAQIVLDVGSYTAWSAIADAIEAKAKEG